MNIATRADIRPLALGYLRLHTADQPEAALKLTSDMQHYADSEWLTLGNIYTDVFDPPGAGAPARAGFCALMDALRRTNAHTIIIPTADHLSRRPSGFFARRTIIESEGGATLRVISSAGDSEVKL